MESRVVSIHEDVLLLLEHSVTSLLCWGDNKHTTRGSWYMCDANSYVNSVAWTGTLQQFVHIQQEPEESTHLCARMKKHCNRTSFIYVVSPLGTESSETGLVRPWHL